MSASKASSISLVDRLANDHRLVHAVLVARGLARIEWIAVLAVAATPVALAADYRLGPAPVSRAYSFRPTAENGGFPVTYLQLFGWTQIVWLTAGAIALINRRTRRGFRSPPTALLALFAGVLFVVTALTSGIDQFAALAFFANVLPLVAMCGVLLHVEVSRRTTVWLIAYFGIAAGAAILVTLARDTIRHELNQRFSVFLFGSPTYAAAVLVATAFVVAAAQPFSRPLRTALVSLLAVGVALTQTRGAIVGAATGLLCVALLHRRARLPASVGVVVATALLVFGPIRPLSNASNTVRAHDVGHHLHVLASRPLVGYGVTAAYADAFRGADNTLVGIADASGLTGVTIWMFAWLLPSALLLRSRRLEGPTSFAVGAVAAMVATWITTGNEVLIYAPPTNLLPLVFAAALLEARRLHSLGKTGPGVPIGPAVSLSRFPIQFAFLGAGIVLLLAGAVAGATPARIPPEANARVESNPGDSARALAAAEGVGFSSCGPCRLISLVEVSPRTWQAHLSAPHLKPSACFLLDLKAFAPRPPGQLPPGVNWVPCAPELDRYGVVPPGTTLPPSNREASLAHSAATAVAADSCGNCRIKLVARAAADLWQWRAIGFDLKPSPCFYVVLNHYQSQSRSAQSAIWVSCRPK